MDKDVDALLSHELIDSMERECMKQFGVHLVIHYDPVSTNDPETNRLKQLVSNVLKIKDDRLEIHDFRMIKANGTVRLSFDMAVPLDLQITEESITSALEQTLNLLDDAHYIFDITFDMC